MKDFAKDTAWLLREKYHGLETPEFLADCVRLEAGEPLAYLIGHVPFLQTSIWLDSKPLIPRVETEFWTEKCLTHHRIKKPTAAILDLCAGSGCIGVALGQALPACSVTFIESEGEHVATISKNCRVNNLTPDRYTILVGDLFTPLSPKNQFDLIVTNPPYIDEALGRTHDSVKDYEPRKALYSDEEGFSHLKKIILAAPNYLAAHGELWIEHEPEHVAAIAKIGALRFSVNTQLDQYDLERFTQLVLQ